MGPQKVGKGLTLEQNLRKWSSELGLFCAVTIDGIDDSVMTSPDGINWTARTSSSSAAAFVMQLFHIAMLLPK